MKNKILIIIIIFLLPIAIYYLFKENNTAILKEDEIKNIIVNLNYQDQNLALSLNDYLIGVVGAEMPASFNLEALKAQAIASRTFLLFNLKDNMISTNVSEQAYNTFDELKNKWQDQYDNYFNKVLQAVTATDNLVIKYNNNLIKAYYYAMSNGYTEDPMVVFNETLPYLTVVNSSFDENVKNYSTTTTISYLDFCQALNINCDNFNISNVIKDESGRVKTMEINGQNFDGINIRKMLHLKSTDFAIEKQDDNINITTRGYGHGVGMSQYGANYLANNNYNYEEILKYYYKNVEITTF